MMKVTSKPANENTQLFDNASALHYANVSKKLLVLSLIGKKGSICDSLKLEGV